MSELLQPCPVCRRPGLLAQRGETWHAGCTNPKCTLMPSNAETADEAVAQWNKRKAYKLAPPKK